MSVEASFKASYNYKKNVASYNSGYASRTLSETQSTDNDDFISGRSQFMNIWRYRVVGLVDQNGLNSHYDAVFPGPVVNFKASGLDLDWYQPLQENGNILSYPPPSNGTFNPPDVGTYGIPCPSGDKDCKDGIKTVSGEMIPATSATISGTSGTLVINYTNTTGSGNTISYNHKLASSTDVKVGYTAESKGLVATSKSLEVALNLSTENNWGNTLTNDSTTTETTGITISRSAINSAQSYVFFPTSMRQRTEQ